MIRLHGIRATFGSREFSGFWVLFLTIWNSNLLRFFWSGLRHHRPREERILVSGAWECLRPPFLHRSDFPTFLIRCSINCRGIAKIHRRLWNRCRLLLRSRHSLTPSLRPVLRQRGLHLGRNPKPPTENSARRLSSSAAPCLRSNPRQKSNSRRRPRSLKAPASILLGPDTRPTFVSSPALSPARAAGPI